MTLQWTEQPLFFIYLYSVILFLILILNFVHLLNFFK